MKKLILITSCVALCAVTSFAQDSTKIKTEQPKQESSTQMRNDDTKGWTRVQSTDVPENLRTTLGTGTQYTGWESGTIYKNQAGDMYQVKTSGNNPKTYYFDKSGKATTKPNH